MPISVQPGAAPIDFLEVASAAVHRAHEALRAISYMQAGPTATSLQSYWMLQLDLAHADMTLVRAFVLSYPNEP